jgi:hypothetical protein
MTCWNNTSIFAIFETIELDKIKLNAGLNDGVDIHIRPALDGVNISTGFGLGSGTEDVRGLFD